MTRNDFKKNHPLLLLKIEDYLTLPHHVYLKTKKGLYLECNDTQARSFGYDCGKDIIGQTDYDFFHQRDANILKTNDTEVIESDTSKTYIEQVTFLNREKTAMLSLKIPFRNKAAKVIGILGISLPIAEESIQLNSAIPLLSSTLDMIKYNNKIISKRERECLECLVKGMTAKEIAKELKLSPRTIEFYINNLKRKFNCVKRVELIVKALQILK